MSEPVRLQQRDSLQQLRAELRAKDESLAALLAAILDELQRIHTTLRRKSTAAPELVAALADFFGDGRFTTRGVLEIAESERDGPIAAALAQLIDMNAPDRSRATQLGILLRRMPEIELVAERGVAVFRLRDLSR